MAAAPGSREEALLIAATRGRTLEVMRLLRAGVSANVTNECMSFLVAPAAGASLEAIDEHGWTPLHLAAGSGHTESALQLVAAGASLDARDQTGTTPLHQAAVFGHTECARQLVAAGASLEASDERGSTPLHFAASCGHTDCARQLVAAGARVDARDEASWTPLHVAASCGHTDCARQLVAAGASLEASDEDGKTAADLAAEQGHHDLAQMLRAARASLGAADQARVNTSQRGHLMFSGRFDGSVAEDFIRATHQQMMRRHPSIPTRIVEASAGRAFGRQTMEGCAGMAALAAFCWSNYGEETASNYSTYYELKFAYENNVPIIPIKMCQEWPPAGGNQAGNVQNKFVFKRDLVYLDLYSMSQGRDPDPAALADYLADAYCKLFA